MLWYFLVLVLVTVVARQHLPQVYIGGRRGHVIRAAIAAFVWVIAVASTMSLGVFIVLGVPFVLFAPFGAGWLACRVVRSEHRLIMRLGWGLLCGSVLFCIALPILVHDVGNELVVRIGDYRLAVYAATGLFITSWLGAIVVAGSSPLTSDAGRLPDAGENGR